MKKGKKFLSLFLAAALAVTGISVGAPVTAEATGAQTAKVTIGYETVSGDDSIAIKAPKEVTADVGSEYTYQVSDDERTITADDGTVYEYEKSEPANGKITVTADDGTGAPKNKISLIYKKKAGTIGITGVTLDKTTCSVGIGGTVQLTATIAPANANTDKTLTWSSDKTTIATVNQTGKVTGVAVGEANITVTTKNGKTATCKVTVTNPIEVAGVTLDQTTLSVEVGKTAKLVATVTPDNATNKELSWDSEKKDIATVSQDGTVTGVKAGTTKITVTTKNNKTATCDVTVTPAGTAGDVEITGVSLDQTTLSIAESGTATLTATIEPANATTDKTLEWKSDNKDVVTVESDGTTGATVTGVKEGTAKITVSTKNGKTATCDVTVTPAGNVVEITGVKLDKTTLSIAEKGTAKLNATIEPANATTDKTLEWKSDKVDVATVSQDGTVTGVKAGTAKITVTTKNGKTAACDVTVTSAGTGTGTTEVKVSLDKEAVTLAVGKDVTLKATVNPANAGNVSWTSSDDKVATVVNGKVTAKKAGTAKITAAVGTKSAVCTVTVVSLSKTKVTLGVKEKLTLKVNGTTKKVTWKTSNKKVATVTNGKVTAKKANKKAINITATVDGVTLTCKVTVKAAPKKLILKGKKTITVKKNKTVKLKVSLPKNTAGTLKYKSSNKKVAKVDAKGKVKGVKKGTAKITVTAANNKKAKVVVTVKVK